MKRVISYRKHDLVLHHAYELGCRGENGKSGSAKVATRRRNW